MAESIIVSALQRVKTSDEGYITVLPINTTDEVLVDMGTGENLTSRLQSMRSDIDNNRDSVIQDMVTIMTKLSAFLPKPFLLNHIYADDFSNKSSVSVSKGVYLPGKIFI